MKTLFGENIAYCILDDIIDHVVHNKSRTNILNSLINVVSNYDEVYLKMKMNSSIRRNNVSENRCLKRKARNNVKLFDQRFKSKRENRYEISDSNCRYYFQQKCYNQTCKIKISFYKEKLNLQDENIKHFFPQIIEKIRHLTVLIAAEETVSVLLKSKEKAMTNQVSGIEINDKCEDIAAVTTDEGNNKTEYKLK